MTNRDYEPPEEQDLMGAEELREHLRDKAEMSVGTRDLERANRRWALLNSWRYDDD